MLRFSTATLCDFLKVLASQFLKMYEPSRAFSRAFALGASYASLLHYRIGLYLSARGGDWLVSCVVEVLRQSRVAGLVRFTELAQLMPYFLVKMSLFFI